MLSTLRGLMKTAMGWRPAIWRRFMAFPDTSSMQCLPWHTQTTRLFRLFFLLSLLLLPSSCCCAHLVGDFLDGLYAGSIQVVVVLSSLDELVLLDLSLHELSGGHEVVISAVHLVVPPRPRRVWWSHFIFLVNALFFLFVLMARLLFLRFEYKLFIGFDWSHRTWHIVNFFFF